jgi:hypothetical protein
MRSGCRTGLEPCKRCLVWLFIKSLDRENSSRVHPYYRYISLSGPVCGKSTLTHVTSQNHRSAPCNQWPADHTAKFRGGWSRMVIGGDWDGSRPEFGSEKLALVAFQVADRNAAVALGGADHLAGVRRRRLRWRGTRLPGRRWCGKLCPAGLGLLPVAHRGRSRATNVGGDVPAATRNPLALIASPITASPT